MSLSKSARPRFSLIVAVYNVGRYLPDFIASVEAQSFSLDQVEVVMVDDGSTDESSALLAKWCEDRPELVQVLTKSNGGQASARNLGLQQASGEWVSFPDPDDMLVPEYLTDVDSFLSRHEDSDMVATNRLLFRERRDKVVDKHPLRMMFLGKQSGVLRSLNDSPTYFHGSAPSAFFKLAKIRDMSLTFDERIRPKFEDGHFCAKYLLACPTPLVGFVGSAKYLYRKRSDASSTLQSSQAHPGRFTDVLEYGYLDVLDSARRDLGDVPLWLQNFLLYELHWYLKSESKRCGSVGAATGWVADKFHELMAQILKLIDREAISDFALVPFEPIWREVLLYSFQDRPWHGSYAVTLKPQSPRDLIRVTYHYFGEAPVEEFRDRGQLIQPRHRKRRSVRMFDRVVLRERIAWVPFSDNLSLHLNGREIQLQTEAPQPLPPISKGVGIRAVLRELKQRPGPYGQTSKALEHASRVVRRSPGVRWRARTSKIRHKYRSAWVLVDRLNHADDSAEQLFRYLREFRSDVNAWFVLKAGTADWDRLVKAGYAERMVAYKSTEWTLLMLNCEVVVSSHADKSIQSPSAIRRQFGEQNWRFVLLQQGVLKDDLSNWLNPKSLDLLIVSTRNEYASIAGEDTSYRYSTKETKLTELPRFDKLWERGQESPPAQRDLVLVAPAGRDWLAVPEDEGSQRGTVSPALLDSDYARNWIGFLESEDLAAAVRDQNLRLAVLPHPNLAPVIAKLDLPEYVLMLGFLDQDVQSYLARSALLVTDYSSMAFDAAYLERPLVYFQFDAELMFGGRQADSQGYFDYQEQGFGPVADDLAGAIGSACSAIAYGPTPSSQYLERVQQSFPYRDGRASERVANEISALLTPGGSMADGHLNEPPASFVSRTLPADPAAKATRFR